MAITRADGRRLGRALWSGRCGSISARNTNQGFVCLPPSFSLYTFIVATREFFSSGVELYLCSQFDLDEVIG